MKKLKRLLCVFSAVLGTVVSLFCEEKIFSWDFTNCDVKDVLFAVSMDTGISILADDTVSGKCDLRFIGNDFEKAFNAFLSSCRLYVNKENDIWTVSRFRLEVTDGLYFLDAFDLSLSSIIEKLSERIEPVITFEALPSGKVSLHFKNLNEEELMENLARSFGSLQVVKNDRGFHFSKGTELKRNDVFDVFVQISKNAENGFEINVRDGRFSEVLEKLFSVSGEDKSFCLLGNTEGKVQRAVFTGKDFDDALGKLCRQNGCNYVVSDGIYYIVADMNSRLELVSGEKKWERFNLKFTKPENFISLISRQLGKLESFVLPNQSAFFAYVSEAEKQLIQQLADNADEKQSSYILCLKYLKPDELMKHLPPAVEKTSLVLADDNSCLYFTGTEAAYKNLCQQIELCDRPVQRLSYDLLILQYDESEQNCWNPSMSGERLSLGDRNGLGIMLGSVMNLNLNVVGAFGLNFAASLQASIESNRTKVFADTTLHGVSGKQINFQNTNTYRYRDNNLDPETGKPVYSGVTREITSGIKLDVLGWVSGDGMITSTVKASVSRQGTDTSASTGNPPPTTEKIVTTEVRGKSGEPVVLSGLLQNSDSTQEKRTPVLSRIPLLGRLFKAKNKITEKSQMVIYLVPHLDGENEKEEELYTKNWAEKRIGEIVK